MKIQQILFAVQALGVILGILGVCVMMVKTFQSKLRRTRRKLFEALRRDPLGKFLIRCYNQRSLGTAKVPVVMFALSVALFAFSISASLIHARLISLGAPYERFVGHHRFVDLTHWNRDYSAISNLTDIASLKMGDPRVTDETLENLSKLNNLMDLDLSNTHITDEGLRILAQLPNLRYLDLQGTQITDDGFRDHLLYKESLTKINLIGTGVTDETNAEWSSLSGKRRLILNGKTENPYQLQKKLVQPSLPSEPATLATKLVFN